MVKISQKIQDKIDAGQTFFSFEYFPPKTEKGVENLFERMKKMAAFDPTFCDITWGAGGSTADLTTEIAIKMQNVVKVETMMHLTCTNMEMEKAYKALAEVKAAGVENILALRGDPPAGQERWTAIEGGFECALDLVKYIRKEYGDFFGICVAGYPEAHPDKIGEDGVVSDEEYQKDLAYLKQKVDAGGEMVITQLFYDADLFIKFVGDCRNIGIKVPIIPGIMPIQSYGGFKKMTGFCKTRVPQQILDSVEAVKDDEAAVKKFGIDLGIEMCKKLLENGTPGLHMYSLNQDKTVLSILQGLGLIADIEPPIAAPREDEPADVKQVAVASC